MFKEAFMKDLVLLYARKYRHLHGQKQQPYCAGIRLEILDFLERTHKNMDAYGYYYLRQKYGKTTRCMIKFDPPEISLILRYKLPGTEIWRRATPAIVQAFQVREDDSRQ